MISRTAAPNLQLRSGQRQSSNKDHHARFFLTEAPRRLEAPEMHCLGGTGEPSGQAMIWPAATGTNFSTGVPGLSSVSRFKRGSSLVSRRVEPRAVR